MSQPILTIPQSSPRNFARTLDDLGYYSFLFLLAGVVISVIAWVKSRSISYFFTDPLLLFYAVLVTSFQFSRLVSALFYKHSYRRALQSGLSELEALKNYEPRVSFVVPCMNEEGAIRKTVTQCFLADYPADKLEVIVINDGSTDRTGEILAEMQKEYPQLMVITFEKNQGKRYGMWAGFHRATGEIVIQLDSDSYIRPETFRALIEPFRSPEIGGVCAHADPENSDYNWLTRMQSAYYFMSFRILKAAESSYGVVFCLSGCSSAYRREAVMPVLDRWLHEEFLGLPVTWGDDRGLTNWVVRQGYKTIYTDESKAFTIVPTTLRQFFKQQIRWKKGWFVNSFFAGKFIWKREPFVAFVYFFPLTLITLLTPFMAARALFYTPWVGGSPAVAFYLMGTFLMTALLAIYYRVVARENKYWPYLFVWSAINTVALSFLMFYALATIQNRKWGTR